MKDILLSWHTEEYRHIPKDTRWFKRAIIFAIFLLVVSLYLQNFLFSFLIVVGTFSFITLGRRHPNIVEFGITNQGVFADKTLYLFQTLESFWVREEEHGNTLVLKSERHIMPYIIIPLGNEDIDHVRELISRKLHEFPHEKTPAEVFAEYIGF